MRKLLGPGLLVGMALLVSAAPAAVVKVFVSIPPQAFFVERVGGDRVEVEVMVPPGRSPHDYAPTPKQMAALSDADVYFSIGVAFEKAWLDRIAEANPRMRIVDTRKGIRLLPMSDHVAWSVGGGPKAVADLQAEHLGEPDPHIWMSPRLVKLQARTIYLALAEADPAGSADYERNFRRFVSDIDRVDNEILFALQDLGSRDLFVFHPAFGYFADAYQLNQVPVEIGGKEPSARQLAELISMAKERGVRVVFVQPQFSAAAARAIAEAIGGGVVPIDPLARDWLANLQDIAAKVQGALR